MLAPMLDRVADDLWTTARPQRFWGLETGTRMTVARLSDGALFVHCPVALDEAAKLLTAAGAWERYVAALRVVDRS